MNYDTLALILACFYFVPLVFNLLTRANSVAHGQTPAKMVPMEVVMIFAPVANIVIMFWLAGIWVARKTGQDV